MTHPEYHHIEFNTNYILIATFAAGSFVAFLVYYFLQISHTRHVSIPELEVEVEDDIDDTEEQKPTNSGGTKKIGVKKAAKLAMKNEKRLAREAMERERAEKKQEQEYLDQLRKEQEEKERLEQEAKDEEERLAKEEQARKDHEAYLEMAASFKVEDEGCEPEVDDLTSIAQFISYIQEKKVVLLEDLAAHFKMRTKDVLNRLQVLLSNGSLLGIIDDRGKFIGLTIEELDSIAKFIRQRGRVSVDEIVVNSNRLINISCVSQ